jgi:hypothetical protein
MNPTHGVHSVAALMLALASGMTAAAPLSGADAEADPMRESQAGASGGGNDVRMIDRDAVRDVPNTPKTIEMLLEMQGRNPGLAAGEPPKPADPVDVATRARLTLKPSGGILAEGMARDPSNPFASGDVLPAKPKPAPADDAVGWTEAPASRFSGLGSVLSTPQSGAPRDYGLGKATQTGGDEGDRISLIPRPLIRFVRNNRDLVIGGSVAVLMLLWGASAFASRRRK